MGKYFPAPQIVAERKKLFPIGERVELVKMNDPYVAIEKGMRGTVIAVDDVGTVHVAWDNGSTLGAVYGEDVIRVTSYGRG